MGRPKPAPVSASDVEDLYRRYGFQVERRCSRILQNPEEAADAAQEVFMRLITKGGDFQAGSSWMTWLYRVATNVCLNRLRDSARRKELLAQHGDALIPNAPGSPMVVDDRDFLAQLLSRFDEKTQAIAIYYFLDELSQSEIGEIMGISRVSVNKRLMRFRAAIKEHAGKLEAA